MFWGQDEEQQHMDVLIRLLPRTPPEHDLGAKDEGQRHGRADDIPDC